MRAKLVGVLVAGCTASALAPGAVLADTLDQQQLLHNADIQVQSGQSAAQTFTAGLSGGVDRVELLLGYGGSGPPTAPLTVEIRNASAGSPGSTVLSTGSVPAAAVSSTNAFVPIAFATAAPVSAGAQYAIVAYSSTDGTHHFRWGGQNGGAPYAGGEAFFQGTSPPGPTWIASGVIDDQAFKTYVEVPAPPTPTATGPTGRRAAAKKKCKKKFDKGTKKRFKCLKKARKLPV